MGDIHRFDATPFVVALDVQGFTFLLGTKLVDHLRLYGRELIV
ncbi:hypothetical protein [Ensifer sp. Root423]|nr:hypothetical protein [Ensifer sp. Root423]